MSLPTRERGLKSDENYVFKAWNPVAPYAGAWIEILVIPQSSNVLPVAPYAGAWIEIFFWSAIISTGRRRSLRGSVD